VANRTEHCILAGKRIVIPRKADEDEKLRKSLITLKVECVVTYKAMISSHFAVIHDDHFLPDFTRQLGGEIFNIISSS